MRHFRSIGLATAIFMLAQGCSAPPDAERLGRGRSAVATGDTANVTVTLPDGTTTEYAASRADVEGNVASVQDNGNGTYTADMNGTSYVVSNIADNADGSTTALFAANGSSVSVRIDNVANLSTQSRATTSSIHTSFIFIAIIIVAAIFAGVCISQERNMVALCAQLNASNTDPNVVYSVSGPVCARTCSPHTIGPPPCCCGTGCACTTCPRATPPVAQ